MYSNFKKACKEKIIWPTMTVLISVYCLATLSDARADAIFAYHAARFAYFWEQGILPIFVPKGEMPGDVYADFNGTSFLVRRGDCMSRDPFPGEEQVSKLPAFFDTNLDEANVRADMELEALSIAMAQAGASKGSAVRMEFSDVTTRSLSQLQLKSYMSDECRGYLASIISRSEQNFRIPWILQSVWYARESIEFASDLKEKEKAAATFSILIKKFLNLREANVAAKQEGGSTIFEITNRKFPVGWRPAFISRQHLEEVHRLQSRGLINMILQWLRLERPEREVFREINRDFPDLLPAPREIAIRMSEGTLVPFDEKNRDHVEYIRSVDALFAAALERQLAPQRVN